MVDMRCTGADVGVDADGKPLDGGTFVLSLNYIKVCFYDVSLYVCFVCVFFR